jgi:hypothetical protein
MAKLDQGYRRTTSAGRSSRGGGRGRTMDTYLAQTRKDQVVDMYLRTETKGILDALGLEGGLGSDMAMSIKQMLRDDARDSRMTKADLGDAWQTARRDGFQAQNAPVSLGHLRAAEALMDALYSATRLRERTDLDEGDLLDDPVGLLTDGGGWGEEAKGRLEVRKHVSVAIDNSGSTHMPETGYCSGAMERIATDVMRMLFEAASTYPALSYDGFSFNRVAIQHTGRYGQDYREGLVRDYFAQIIVDDPLKRDAVQTNLAPLIEAMHKNEEALGLIGQPRLDLILTDGEFESEADAEAAAEWQRKRGPGVTTYVLNLCPGEGLDTVDLPHQFRVIPVHCLRGDGVKAIDQGVLRQVLTQIVITEASNLEG